MRRSQSVLDVKNDNNNILDNYEEGNKTNKLTQKDINKLYGKNSYSRKLKKIDDELNQFDPDTLMLKVDPTKNITKTIKQIQLYYNNIKNEINKYINQEKLEASLKKKISKIPKQIELLVHPPNYQKYNTIKSKNNKLLIQLEEMRKENLFYMNKLSELKKDLKEKEKHYNETKSKVEENINKNNKNESLNDIIEKQATLNKKTQEMTDNILDSNSEYIEKLAKNKYLDFQKNELVNLIKELEVKRDKEHEAFNNEIRNEYDKIKDYKKESKILNELDKEKMEQLEELFNEILEETKTQNSIQLIEHFSRTREENISFKSSVKTLYEYVDKLQEEVNTLEYIISFCEEEMKNKVKLGENDIKNVDDINKASSLYIKLQYNVIKVLYKQYTDRLFEILKMYNVDLNEKYLFKSENINAFIEFTVDLQEKLKKIADRIKIESGSLSSKSYFDFNKWNNKWDKINMAKDEVIKEYNNNFGKGLKFNKKNIKSLVDVYLVKDRKASLNKK